MPEFEFGVSVAPYDIRFLRYIVFGQNVIITFINEKV